MSELDPASLARLVRSVAILALPYEAQLAWLRSLGLGEPGFADELSLELDDGVLLSRQFVEAGWLSAEARHAIIKLSELITPHNGHGHDEFWSLDGLRTSVDWTEIRDVALVALTLIR